MKNKFLTLVAVTALFVSCQDAYEVSQPGYQFEDTAVYKNNTDINRGISGLYSSLPGESEIDFVSYFTDELGVGVNNAGQGINDGSYKFFMNAGNGFASSTWTSYYNIINRCNRLLNRIDELKAIDGSAAENEYNNSRGRLLVIRAYAHMKLFAYFTPDYKNPNGLSVIKFDFLQTTDYNRFEKRATVAEIVSFIEQDIEEALGYGIEYSAGTGENIKTKAYISKSFARSVLVKLYAMTGNSAGVFEQANSIIGSVGTPLDFISLFEKDSSSAEANPDVISYLLRLPTESYAVAGAWWAGRVDAARGSAYMEIGRSLYNELDRLDPASTNKPITANRLDVRFGVTVLGSSRPQSNYASLSPDQYRDRDLLYIGKYQGSTQAVLQNNIILFRYTDILLAKAEAYAMEGNVSEVEAIIQTIRNARSATGTAVSMPTITNVQSAWKAILEERRLEFAFEGHRYLDMKRIGVLAGSPGFVRDPKDCELTQACLLEPTSYKLTLPIPRVEIQANPAIASQQNPGY